MRVTERLRLIADAVGSAGAVTISTPDLLRWLDEDAADQAKAMQESVALDLDVAEMAIAFRKSQSTVRKWVRDKWIETYPDGKTRRATPDAIERFKERMRAGEFGNRKVVLTVVPRRTA